MNMDNADTCKYLQSLENGDAIKLTEEQILMLQLSDNDIKTGKLIQQAQLDSNDLEWLKG
jgi:hypothetical protein